jgi:hypothetical protein
MSTEVDGRKIHRSSKDLGRVLAFVYLVTREETETWPAYWRHAVETCFPSRLRELSGRVGLGLRALLADDERFEEAWHCADRGLLNGKHVTLDQLRATAEQFLEDAIIPFENASA